MYCIHCGEKILDDSDFCPFCGQKTSKTTDKYPDETINNNTTQVTDVGQNIRMGFSEKINDPAIRAAMKKNGKGTLIFAIIIILAPIIITFIIGVKNDDMGVVGGGAVISIVFLVINLISGVKKKGEKQWDGVVIDKRVETIRKKYTPEGDRDAQASTVYKTLFQAENGKIKILEEPAINNVYYNYLNVGDKVRYYPQFTCYYEKFDKSRDTYAICPICATKNDISKDTCSRCGVPIIK